ncbi:hypothetical protein J3R30DRAFT_3286530 [Lentinula aciculospora]|uniref:C2H2-type domain-containing protein n=1 Tax=Lentinula aciculospora TaxID=153920 RepID=A0A9W9AK54_9AGAR|nr:hypothetical protein J3R30DRAFT_3286530 [Lentinula aciculospora]
MADYTVFSTNGQYDHNTPAAYTKRNQDEHFSYSTTADDVLAPTIDEFDSYLDALLEGNNFDIPAVPTTIPQTFQLRDTDLFNCGPASTFTFSSSESSYDSRSTHSESSYGPPARDTVSHYPFSVDLDSEFQKFSVDTQAQILALDCIDRATFSAMPTGAYSPTNLAPVAAMSYDRRSSFSDYGPSTDNTGFFLSQLASYGTIAGATVSADQINAQLTELPSITLSPLMVDPQRGNSSKKYKCDVCTRAFDRAFNLKTHMDTHNPDRKKPFVCPHRSCHRAFSRKHDLGRHITSLHRNEATPLPSAESIGVGNAARKWCDICGKGSVGSRGACNCDESDSVK